MVGRRCVGCPAASLTHIHALVTDAAFTPDDAESVAAPSEHRVDLP
ncbi:MAG: hypothetical protein ACYSUF_11425 [Planctomycetota bacterium]